MPARETQGTNNGWIARICDRLALKRGKRSQKNGGRPYASDQAVDIRARFNKDVELLQQPLKVGDRVLSNGDLCELTQIGDDLIPQDPHVGTACHAFQGIMSSFSFLFLGVPRHYAKRPFSCWCHACSRVRGRGLGSQSSGPDLLVSGCTRSNQTAWTEDQFTVTSSAGIRNREKRAADTVARELKRAKPGAWACIQAREVWSTEEEANMRPGQFWICKLGTVPGSMSCVEQKFDLQGSKCKWKEYKGTRYSHGDSTLVVDVWLHRVADDTSGLTFQEWDPSAGTDVTSVPVAMLVNSSELRAADFPLAEVRPLHLDTVSRGGRRTQCDSEKTSGCG